MLPDPCPLPGSVKRRGLADKERLIYAPMADVGGVLYDKDAVYVDIPDWKVRRSLQRLTHMHFSLCLHTRAAQICHTHGDYPGKGRQRGPMHNWSSAHAPCLYMHRTQLQPLGIATALTHHGCGTCLHSAFVALLGRHRAPGNERAHLPTCPAHFPVSPCRCSTASRKQAALPRALQTPLALMQLLTRARLW